MKIRTKILLISAIPVFLLSTFSFSEIKEKNIAISNLVVLKYYSNILVKSSNLIHELQKERGYSSLFISNEGKKFKHELSLQRKNTDKELSNLKDYLFNSKSITDQAVLELESNIKEYLLKINNYRNLINSLNKTPEEAINFYSDIIKNISKYSTELVVLNKSSNSELENLKISYLHLFHLKENMGKERAFVSSILSKNKIDKIKMIKLSSLIQNKKIHEDLLNTFLNVEQKNLYKNLIKSPSMLKMIEVEKILMEKDKEFNFEPALWFKIATQNIDILKKIDDNISREILNKSELIIKVEEKNRILEILLLITSLIISITMALILIYQVNKSINRLINITSKVSEGDINIDINDIKNDEIGELQKSIKGIIVYLQKVSEISNKISKGDLKDLHIVINSDKDLLNKSMNDMINYLKNTAKISEIISNKDLTINIKIESENDLLKVTLKNMLVNLQDNITYFAHLSNLVNDISQKLLSFSDNIAFNADQESAIAEETFASSEEILAFMNSIQNNISLLFKNISKTSESIQKMLDSNRNISNNTELLSSFSKKVYESISDISNSNNNISSNVSEFLSYSNSMLEKTKVEGESIKNTIFKMKDILDIVQQVKDSINKSNKKSKEISLIVDLIQDIAQQTNLLSLNASIEAARAGEHGRGFAVVAQEIRVLAEKSANSTKQIYDLIKTVQDYSNEATITSEKGKESIEDTFRVIKDTSSMLDFIVTQMNYSSSKVSEISTFLDIQNNSSQSLLNNAEQMISMIISLDQETKKQLEESSKIIEASENMNSMTQHIEKSVMEQIVANEQISNSMRLVSDSSLKNLDMAVELSNMTKELDDNSKNMKDFISTFKLT